MNILTVREYACLTTAKGIEENFDRAVIPPDDLDWLIRLCGKYPQLGALQDRNSLVLKNLVGTLTLPSGLQLEILPKTAHEDTDIPAARHMLCKMLRVAMDVPAYDTGSAPIEMFRHPLTDWVAYQFLLRLHRLVQVGLRFSYSRVAERKPFIRGQLDVQRQLRELPNHWHLFNIRHDIFSPDRPENRLLKSALRKIEKSVSSGKNWRLSGQLLQAMETIPPSVDTRDDFTRWGKDRLVADYAAIRPWCALVLGQDMPFAIAGRQLGMSFLFSMPSLFERYVARKLSGIVLHEVYMQMQKTDQHLCTYNDNNHFCLKPDILLAHVNGQKIILDTKWKRLERLSHPHKDDVTQLYVYGQCYLKGQGKVGLIYPHHADFPEFNAPFKFQGSALYLHILAYDLDTDCIKADPSFPFAQWFRKN